MLSRKTSTKPIKTSNTGKKAEPFSSMSCPHPLFLKWIKARNSVICEPFIHQIKMLKKDRSTVDLRCFGFQPIAHII